MKSDPYANLPVMAPPIGDGSSGIGVGTESVGIGEAVCGTAVDVGVAVGIELTLGVEARSV